MRERNLLLILFLYFEILSLVSLFPAGKVTKAGKLFNFLKKYGKGDIADAVAGMGKVLKHNSKAVLMEGTSSNGWKHIVENHITGKSGKTLFSKHMGEGVNADFILTHHRRFRIDPPGDFLLVRW